MLSLRKLSSGSPVVHAIKRTAALRTVSTSSGPTTAPPTPSASTSSQAKPTVSHGRRKRQSLLQKPQKWHRALPPAVLPAYDLALNVLQKDSQKLKAELEGYRKTVDELQASYKTLSDKLASVVGEEKAAVESEMRALDEVLEKVLEKANIIEVQSEINLPDVRWQAGNYMGKYCFFCVGTQ